VGSGKSYLVEIYCRDHNLRRQAATLHVPGSRRRTLSSLILSLVRGTRNLRGPAGQIASSRRPTIPQPGLAAASPQYQDTQKPQLGQSLCRLQSLDAAQNEQGASLSHFCMSSRLRGVYVDTATGEYSSAQLSIDFAQQTTTAPTTLFSSPSLPLPPSPLIVRVSE